MKNLFVLDTNVLLSDPDAVFSFKEHDIIIPMTVLEELDRHKSRQDDVGSFARATNRILDDLRFSGSLQKGVKLPSGGTLSVKSISDFSEIDVKLMLPSELDPHKPDNQIIAFTKAIVDNFGNSEYSSIILVTRDINVRVKCDVLGLKSEDYKKSAVAADPKKFYRGVEVIDVSQEIIDSMYANKKLAVQNAFYEGKKLYPNEIIVLKNASAGDASVKSAITKYNAASSSLLLVSNVDSVFGVKPRNKEQKFAFDLLFDDNIKLLTLAGPAGTGKSLITFAAGLEQLSSIGKQGKFNKMVIIKPVQPVGKEIGFLPGSLEEKLEPWTAPINDCLEFLMGSKKVGFTTKLQNNRKKSNNSEHYSHHNDNSYLSLMKEKGLIEVDAMTFIRGRTIANAFIVIDESQNLTLHELKTIVTRAGDGSKIVLTGDIEQIDNPYVDVFTNGLAYAVERFKETEIAGHVTLIKGERSTLATIASKVL